MLWPNRIGAELVRLRRVEGPGMTVMQQTRKRLALGVTSLHRGLEQRFLDVARHVTPYDHRSLSEQIGEAFLPIDHFDPPLRSLTDGNGGRLVAFHAH